MKVAQIGNVGDGSADHSTENELRRALEHIGVTVLPIHELRFDWNPNAVPSDAACVLWTHTHGFAPERTHKKQSRFLEAMRRRQVPTVGYHLDLWFGISRQHQVAEEPFFRQSLVVTADGGHDAEFVAAGVQHAWFPPGVSEFECQPGIPRDEYRSDVAFVGSWAGGYHREWKHRQQLVDFLRETYGERCRFWPEIGQPAIRGADLRDLYASVKVLVGDSCLPNGATKFWSDRIPECVGRGGLLIHPDVDGLEQHYKPGEHLLTWPAGDWDSLANTIDAALTDDDVRHEISTAGRAHVLEHHTYTTRARQLLALLRDRGLIRE